MTRLIKTGTAVVNLSWLLGLVVAFTGARPWLSFGCWHLLSCHSLLLLLKSRLNPCHVSPVSASERKSWFSWFQLVPKSLPLSMQPRSPDTSHPRICAAKYHDASRVPWASLSNWYDEGLLSDVVESFLKRSTLLSSSWMYQFQKRVVTWLSLISKVQTSHCGNLFHPQARQCHEGRLPLRKVQAWVGILSSGSQLVEHARDFSYRLERLKISKEHNISLVCAVNRGTEEMRNISSGAFAPSAPSVITIDCGTTPIGICIYIYIIIYIYYIHIHISTLHLMVVIYFVYADGNWKVWSGPFALASLWDPDPTKSYPNIRLFKWQVGEGSPISGPYLG